jgi:hypothetical protein
MPAAMRTHTTLVVAFLSAACVVSAGCSTTTPTPPSALAVTQSTKFDGVPPAELVEQIRQAVGEPPLSLSVEPGGDEGVLLTGYQEFPGEWHIARRWQERTRYRISIVPDFKDPDSAGRVEVTPETQQRPSGRHKWTDAPELHRPERAEAVLRYIGPRVGDGAER